MNPKKKLPTRLLRRIHLMDRLIRATIPNMHVCDYETESIFVDAVFFEVSWLYWDEEYGLNVEGINLSDIENYISNYKYDELAKYYREHCNKNLQEHIRRVLKEETKISPRLLRRLGKIDNIFKYYMSSVYRPNVICRYKSGEQLLNSVSFFTIEKIYHEDFEDMDDTSEEWEVIGNFIEKYITEKYSEEINNYYHMNCAD